MEIKKFIVINEEVKENRFLLTMSYNEAFQPILIFRNTGVVLPIPINLVLEVLESAKIINKNLEDYYSFVQNEANEIIKLVVTNSSEYKKIINAKTLKTNKIKQGTLVKLQSEERLIFLQTVKLAKQYSLRRIQDFYDKKGYIFREPTEKEVKNLFKTYNLFLDPVRQVLELFDISIPNKRVVECFDVIPEYNEKNYSIKNRFNLRGCLFVDKLSFINSEETKSINIQIGENTLSINNRLVSSNNSYYIAFNSNELKPLLNFINLNNRG